jgi:hypothetical protein
MVMAIVPGAIGFFDQHVEMGAGTALNAREPVSFSRVHPEREKDGGEEISMTALNNSSGTAVKSATGHGSGLTLQAVRQTWLIVKGTGYGFIADEALSRGAAIAFYTATSPAPVLLIVIAIAGSFLDKMPRRRQSLVS